MPKLPEDKLEAAKIRYAYSLKVSRLSRIAQGERLEASKKLFSRDVLLGDIHTHSTYSDGVGTVEENWDMAKACGFDFMFATDHSTVAQKRHCRENGLWWGQEVGCGAHHVVIHASTRTSKQGREDPRKNLIQALKISPFGFVAHPAGWWPSTMYDEERVRQLDAIAEPFAIEVMNGANKLDRAYDRFDKAAIKAWDRLLCMGRQVSSLGGSDAPAGSKRWR